MQNKSHDELITKIVECRRKRFERDGYSFNEKDSYLLAEELINETRNDYQLEILKRFVEVKEGMRICEIGTGHGRFIVTAVNDGMDAEGVEADDEILKISKDIISFYDIDPQRVKFGLGENLDYPDDTFDVVLTTSVLEHVNDVSKVIRESVRVAKQGGIIIHNFPNYRSFVEGHFKSFWLPFFNHKMGKLFLRLCDKLTGNPHNRQEQDYNYVDTLNFTSLATVKKTAKMNLDVEIISLGKEIWMERLKTLDLSVYWGFAWLSGVIKIVRLLRLTTFLGWLGIVFGFYTPIVMVLRKKIK